MTAPAAVWRGIRRRILDSAPCPLADPDAPAIAEVVHHPPFRFIPSPDEAENLEALPAGAHRARAAKAIRRTLDGGLDA